MNGGPESEGGWEPEFDALPLPLPLPLPRTLPWPWPRTLPWPLAWEAAASILQCLVESPLGSESR